MCPPAADIECRDSQGRLVALSAVIPDGVELFVSSPPPSGATNALAPAGQSTHSHPQRTATERRHQRTRTRRAIIRAVAGLVQSRPQGARVADVVQSVAATVAGGLDVRREVEDALARGVLCQGREPHTVVLPLTAYSSPSKTRRNPAP